MMELVGRVKTAREQDVHRNPGLIPGTFFIAEPVYRQESQGLTPLTRPFLNRLLLWSQLLQECMQK
jgi:hypothetical protein